ncbi:MAG TPA: AAA family ATPase [Candidatus Acidoferrales bacterium]|nr:AAA family ATPase [Candidatus Acidoferrales bacterium]
MPEQDPLRSDFARDFKRLIDAMNTWAVSEQTPLMKRLETHLGGTPQTMPIVMAEFDPWEHPNVQVALDALFAKGSGRDADLVGIAVQNKRWGTMTFSDLLATTGPWGRLQEGPVDYVDFELEGDKVLACVQYGLFIVTSGTDRLAVYVGGPPQQQGGPQVKLRVEVIAPDRDLGAKFLREFKAAMNTHNVYRGKVISIAPGQWGVQSLVKFHTLPQIKRDDIVLPAGALERIERHAVGFSQHRDALLKAGRSLHRGVLLYGPPGTGKTLTIMYLATQMPGRTVILTTGLGLGRIASIGPIARDLAPATVVVEDVDLIAQERGLPGQQTNPLLFELMNQMDGLADDADVLFILTTNRPDILEPALAARPGRVDLVLELPVPDADGRRRLLALYARGLDLEGVRLDDYVESTEGASPAYIKELLRRAALIASIDGEAKVRDAHLRQAMEELAAGGELAKRIVGFGTSAYLPPAPSVGPMRPAGYPAAAAAQKTRG